MLWFKIERQEKNQVILAKKKKLCLLSLHINYTTYLMLLESVKKNL